MRKRFVAINRTNRRVTTLIMCILLGLIILVFSFKWIFGLIVNTIINEEKQIDLLSLGTSNVRLIDLNLLNPSDILTVSLNIKKNDRAKLEIISDELEDGPLLYIYNTFDEIKYANNFLAKSLAKYDIPSLIEKRSVSEYLTSKNMKSSEAYTVSREFIDEVMRENETLKYFIDIQTTNTPKDVTNIEIDGKEYAKVLFIVSMDNKFYDRQFEFAETINSMLDKRLSRGIMKKSDTNTSYNQDMDAMCLLIEIGGEESSKESIENTMNIFGEILHEYMSEGYDGN